MNNAVRGSGLVLLAGVAAVGIGACGNGNNHSQAQVGNILSNKYQSAANAAVPYPLAQMENGAWLERRLLKENLLRQNDPNRIAYVTLLSQQGQPIEQFTIQGMVFDLNSQMTPINSVVDGHANQVNSNQGCGQGTCSVVDSPGDNGTYGPEPNGIGFFTTSGVEIKWDGLYIESDAPLQITTKPLIIYNVNEKPSVSFGGLTGTK